MNRLRARLNDMERRHPLAFAVGVVLACDAVLAAAMVASGWFA